jgi:hypothetical protein
MKFHNTCNLLVRLIFIGQPIIEPITHCAESLNPFVVRKDQHLQPGQFWPEREGKR